MSFIHFRFFLSSRARYSIYHYIYFGARGTPGQVTDLFGGKLLVRLLLGHHHSWT